VRIRVPPDVRNPRVPHSRGMRSSPILSRLTGTPGRRELALFPCAPPRLADIGLVDTITTQIGLALDSKLTTAFYNPIAAVPSLHAGFAIAVSAALAAATTRRWLRVLAWTWAPAVCLAVVATGNHFVTDIATGAVVTIAGYALGRAISRLAAGDRPVPARVPAMATSG
jgi:hypothetical protein